jgi:hypothetical protein
MQTRKLKLGGLVALAGLSFALSVTARSQQPAPKRAEPPAAKLPLQSKAVAAPVSLAAVGERHASRTSSSFAAVFRVATPSESAWTLTAIRPQPLAAAAWMTAMTFAKRRVAFAEPISPSFVRRVSAAKMSCNA